MTTGIKFIGRGAYGCVYHGYFKPHKQIKLKIPFDGPYVTKLTRQSQALIEEYGARIIRQVDPQGKFTVLGPVVMPIKLTKRQKEIVYQTCSKDIIDRLDHQLIYQYGGKTLKELLKDKKVINYIQDNPRAFLRKFHNIYQGMIKMYQLGIGHFDIKHDNIVIKDFFAPDSQFKLIDFGLVDYVNEQLNFYVESYAPYPRKILYYNQIPLWLFIINDINIHKITNSMLATYQLSRLAEQWLGLEMVDYFQYLYSVLIHQEVPTEGKISLLLLQELVKLADLYLLSKTIANVFRDINIKPEDLDDDVVSFFNDGMLGVNIDTNNYS